MKVRKQKKKGKNEKEEDVEMTALPNVKVTHATSMKAKKKKKKAQKNIENDEDTEMAPVPDTSTDTTKKKKKKKKKVKVAVAEAADAEDTEQTSDSKMDVVKEPSDTKENKGPKAGSQDRKEQDARTIFVGNVSNKAKRRDIQKFFTKYGKVECVRFRCAAAADTKTSKKVAVITGSFHEKRSSLVAYVRFKKREVMEAALEANGKELMGKHLRVDYSVSSKKHDSKLAIFVGNLGFDAEEEDLREHFTECGEIASVRIIRNQKLGSGKGFGYINFESADAVELALQKNNERFQHRQLRVQRCKSEKTIKRMQKKVIVKKAKRGPLAFLKPTNTKSKKKTKVAGGPFAGKMMVDSKTFKKKKKKGRISKDEMKKRVFSKKLTNTSKGVPVKK